MQLWVAETVEADSRTEERRTADALILAVVSISIWEAVVDVDASESLFDSSGRPPDSV